MQWSTKPWVRLGFLVLITLLVADSVLAYRNTRTIGGNTALVAHTYEVFAEAAQTLSTMIDAETGQRGYLITGRDPYLEPYNSATKHIRAHLLRLQQLTVDNPNQQRRIALLNRYVDVKLRLLQTTIDLRKREGFAAAQSVVLTDAGKQAMDNIRVVIAEIEQEEQALLQRRTAATQRSLGQTRLTFALTSMLALALLAGLGWLTASDIRRRNELLRREHAARVESESALRLRDEFLSVASHELRTPITALLGHTQLLQRHAARDGTWNERDRRALGNIAGQSQRLGKLVETLLDISRIETGRLELHLEKLDLRGVAGRAVENLRPSLRQHTIDLEMAADPVLVRVDELRFEQVVGNLLANAVKYSPQGGAIIVEVGREAGNAFIRISDQGIGIPASDMPHLFQRFYRGSNVDQQNISGFGIGLYLVQEIVRLHGGTIDIASREDGGSTFTIWLTALSDEVEQRSLVKLSEA